jgi:hypothetical protein
MSARAIPQPDLRERVIAAARAAKQPVSFNGLAKSAKVKKGNYEHLRAALESVVAAGQLHRWPDRGKSQYFWNVSPEQRAREVILRAAATQALSKPDLSKAAKNLPGFSVKRLESVVSALVDEQQLQYIPAFASRAKLLVRPGDSGAYFNALRSFVEQKIRLAGFDPAAFFSENSSPRDKLTDTQVDAAALILEAVRSLEPVRGVPVSTLRLRNHLANLSKHDFDAAALELRKKQQVFLSQHADPYNLSPEDKDLLIDGQDGTYYVAIAIR